MWIQISIHEEDDDEEEEHHDDDDDGDGGGGDDDDDDNKTFCSFFQHTELEAPPLGGFKRYLSICLPENLMMGSSVLKPNPTE